MRLSSYLVALCASPLLASCLFLLDYDALQGGAVATGGAAGQPNEAVSGAAGAGGDGASCGDCNDGDPCTIDTCVALPGEAPSCEHQATRGLKADGFQVSLPAEKHLRVTLVGSGKLFYLSVLSLDAAAPQVSLYRLADDGTQLEPMLSDWRLGGNPITNVGLAVEKQAAGEVALHGFVAVKGKLNDAAARVLHLVSRDDQLSSKVVGLSYGSSNPTVFPQALAIGDQIFGAWIQEDGTIALHDVGTGQTASAGDPSIPATTLALLSTRDQRPAVLFTSESDGALGAWVEPEGGSRARLEECVDAPGTYLSSSVIGTQRPGLWLANVTREGESSATTTSGTLACGGLACVLASDDCSKVASSSAIRNVAGATVHFDTDDAGVVYSVIATPELVPGDEGNSPGARLTLSLGRADFGVEPVKKEELGRVEAARSAEEGTAGPDWPAVAILPSRKAAVAWISPSPSGVGTELHVERYEMCLGEP